MSLLQSFERHVQDRAFKPFLALYEGDRFQLVSYRDLDVGARRWARLYRQLGTPPDEVAVIVLRHSGELYSSFLGAMMAGVIPSYLPFPTVKQDPRLYWEAHRLLFERIQPRVAVTYADNADALNAIAAPVGCQLIVAGVDPLPEDDGAPIVRRGGDDLALLQHSSGTTGLKKGVMLTYGQIERHVTAYARSVGFGADDIVASWLPLYHDMGLITSFLMPLSVGASVVALDPFEWVAKPTSILTAIERHRATHSWQPNFALAHMTRTRPPAFKADLSSVKAMVSTSEPCKQSTFDAFNAAFSADGLLPGRLVTSYGMAENVFATTQSSLNRAPRSVRIRIDALRSESRAVALDSGDARGEVFMSCGRPIDGLEVRIDAGPATEGSPVGEICVRGDFLFDGYYKNHEATAAAFDADGWYHSGDIGFLLDGEIFVCGRKKEMLIIHGRNFYANDIEHAVNDVAGVKPGRTVAFAIYEDETGSEEAVVIVESDLVDASAVRDLKRTIKQRVYDVLELGLRRVEVVTPGWLVKSTAGKVSRSENIKKYMESDA